MTRDACAEPKFTLKSTMMGIVNYIRLPVGYPKPLQPQPDLPTSWKLYTLAERLPQTGKIRTQAADDIAKLASDIDRQQARTGLQKLAPHARNGLAFHQVFDNGQYHSAHTFTYSGPPAEHITIYRFRLAGNNRIYTINLQNRDIFIIEISTKRSQKLSEGEKIILENRAKHILEAHRTGKLIEIPT